jgi:aminopeptidase N
MIKIYTLIVVLILATSMGATAQKHKNRKVPSETSRTSVANMGERNYDIKYLRFDLQLTDTATYVTGTVATTAMAVAPMPGYVFELDSAMTIDSASVNGVNLPVTGTGLVRTIALPSMLSGGTVFTAKVSYHGTPSAGGGFFNGLTHSVSTGGTNMVYSVSDPYAAADWWPCKQDIDDKIDSVDMFVTVPAGVTDGGNGLLVGIDTITAPGSVTYHWQTRYAIDYYLISVAVAPYAEYHSYMHFTGSTDSMLVQNFFVDTATFNPLYKSNFDSIGQIVDYYSTLYGRYPFWKEKYGVCYTTLPGGMEHQTMTTIGVPETYIIAHELCHQWFGDHVTYATWGDVWLSEGFATFSEQLFLEHFWSPAEALAHRQGYLNNVISDPCGELFVTDTTTASTLFYEPTVYAKGQGVVTMLRYLAPSDSVFFQMLRNYQQTYAFGNTTTTNLKTIAEAAYGSNLDTFFNQWVYGKGYPVYTVTYHQVGSTIYIKVIQKASCAATTLLFSTPLEFRLHSATADTIVKLDNNADTTIYTVNWAPAVSKVFLNPDIWTLCRQNGLITQDNTLGTGSVFPSNIQINPNPAKDYWEIDHLPYGTELRLTDMAGNLLWKQTSYKDTTIIPANNLTIGDYLLSLSCHDRSESIKLTHW